MPGDIDQRSPWDPRYWSEGSGPIQGPCTYNLSQYTLTSYDLSPLLDSENADTPNSDATCRSIGRRAAFSPTTAQARHDQLTRGTKCYNDQ